MKKLLAIFFPMVILIGCSSDDDSATGGYTGLKTPVKITVENGKDIAKSSLSGAGAGSGAAAGNTDDLDSSNLSKPMGKMRAKARSISAREVVNDTETVDGDCGGTETTTINYNTETKEVFFSSVTENYCDSELDEITSGKMTLNGTLDVDPIVGTMNFSFENFSSQNIAGDESSLVNGTGIVTLEGENSEFTINATVVDNIENKEYLLENFTFDSEEVYDNFGNYLYTLEELDGRVYQADLGYVDLNTVTPFKVDYESSFDGLPLEGALTMTGEAGSQIELNVTSEGQYSLAIDEDGDGTPEETEAGDWELLDLDFIFE